MGNLRAMEMAGAAKEGLLSFDAALEYHLTVNHFPPIRDGLPFAKMAIDAFNEGEPQRVVQQILTPGRGRRARASQIIENWHLEPFLAQEE